MQKAPSGKSTRAGRAIRLLAGLVAVSLILHVGWNIVAGRRLNRVIRVQAAAGLPMSLTAVLPEPVPDSRNAAVPLTAVFSVLGGTLSPGSEDTPETVRRLLRIRFDEAIDDTGAVRRFRDLDRDERAALVKRLAEPDLATVFQLLTLAAEGLPAQFPVKSDAGLAALTPHLVPLRSAHHLLLLRARLAGAAGDTNAALRDLRTALRLIRGLSKEPLMASHQLRIVCDRQALRELRSVLDGALPTAVDPELLRGLSRALAEARDPGLPGIVRALDGERVIFGGWLFLSLLSRDGSSKHLDALPSTPWIRCYSTYLGRPLLKADARVYLLRMAAYRQAVGAADMNALQAMADNPMPRWYPLTRLVEPSVVALWRTAVLRLIDLQLADVAVQLHLYAMEHGAFPDALTAIAGLSEDRLNDPLGQPLVYTRLAGGYRLFSYGFAGPDAEMPPTEFVWTVGE